MLINPNGSYVIYILSPDHCEKVQRRLFELEYYWRRGESEIRYQNRAHRLFLNYDGRLTSSKCITFASCSDAGWPHREGLLPITYEDLFDEPEAPKEPMTASPPTKYHKWHIQCLAKHILAKYAPIGTMREALQIMQRGSSMYSDKELYAYAVKHVHERPEGFPEDLIAELQRRRDA